MEEFLGLLQSAGRLAHPLHLAGGAVRRPAGQVEAALARQVAQVEQRLGQLRVDGGDPDVVHPHLHLEGLPGVLAAAPVIEVDAPARSGGAPTEAQVARVRGNVPVAAPLPTRALYPDQVLVLVCKDDYTLTQTTSWDTMGMRGTRSPGFKLVSSGSEEQINRALEWAGSQGVRVDAIEGDVLEG